MAYQFCGAIFTVKYKRCRIKSNQGFDICEPLRDFGPYAQLKKRKKQPQRSVTFSKVLGFSLQLY